MRRLRSLLHSAAAALPEECDDTERVRIRFRRCACEHGTYEQATIPYGAALFPLLLLSLEHRLDHPTAVPNGAALVLQLWLHSMSDAWMCDRTRCCCCCCCCCCSGLLSCCTSGIEAVLQLILRQPRFEFLVAEVMLHAKEHHLSQSMQRRSGDGWWIARPFSHRLQAEQGGKEWTSAARHISRTQSDDARTERRWTPSLVERIHRPSAPAARKKRLQSSVRLRETGSCCPVCCTREA